MIGGNGEARKVDMSKEDSGGGSETTVNTTDNPGIELTDSAESELEKLNVRSNVSANNTQDPPHSGDTNKNISCQKYLV